MNDISISDTVIRKAETLSSHIDEDSVLMDIDSGSYFTTGSVGTFIWDNLESAVSVADLLQKLQQEFSVSADECTTDTVEFLNALQKKGLLMRES